MKNAKEARDMSTEALKAQSILVENKTDDLVLLLSDAIDNACKDGVFEIGYQIVPRHYNLQKAIDILTKNGYDVSLSEEFLHVSW